MRPKERGDSGQRDLFTSRLDQIVNLQHALVKLSKAIDWVFWNSNWGRFMTTSRAAHPCRRG